MSLSYMGHKRILSGQACFEHHRCGGSTSPYGRQTIHHHSSSQFRLGAASETYPLQVVELARVDLRAVPLDHAEGTSQPRPTCFCNIFHTLPHMMPCIGNTQLGSAIVTAYKGAL